MEEINAEDIKVGEWVRFKNGALSKNNSNYNWDMDEVLYDGSPAVKHSKNIIDLIECGDYVNGILVTGKESTLLYTEIKGIDRSGYHIPISQYGDGIKSIVTKEQFSSVEYRLQEGDK